MRCDEVAALLPESRRRRRRVEPRRSAPRRVVPALPGRARPLPPAAPHASQLLRTRYVEPTPGLLGETLAALTDGRPSAGASARCSRVGGSPTPARSAGAVGARPRATHGRGARSPRSRRRARSRLRLTPPLGPSGARVGAEAPLLSWRLAPTASEGSSSTGRAPVSKTGGWGFESLLPCSLTLLDRLEKRSR